MKLVWFEPWCKWQVVSCKCCNKAPPLQPNKLKQTKVVAMMACSMLLQIALECCGLAGQVWPCSRWPERPYLPLLLPPLHPGQPTK